MGQIVLLHGGEALRKNYSDNKSKSEWQYKIWDVADRAAAQALLLATISESDGDLVLDTAEVEHVECDIYDGTATYITQEWKDEKQEKASRKINVGEVLWSCDGTAGKQTITTGLKTKFRKAGEGLELIDFQGAINVKKTKNGYEINGAEIVVPSLDLTAETKFWATAISMDWIKNTAAMIGTTNSSPFFTFATGELLFMGFQVAQRDDEGKCKCNFKFNASKNITQADNVRIGVGAGLGEAGIGPVEKGGHEYLWTAYANFDVEGQLRARPVQVQSEQVYRESNYFQLGIGG